MCTSCPELQTHKPGAVYRNPKPWERISALPHQTHPRHSLSTSDFSNSISPTAGTKNCDVIPTPLVHSVSSPSDSSSAGGLLVPPVGVLSPLCLCSPPVCARLSSQWPSAPACAACTGAPPGTLRPPSLRPPPRLSDAMPQPCCSLPLTDVTARSHHRHRPPTCTPGRFLASTVLLKHHVMPSPPTRLPAHATLFPYSSSLDCTG